MAHEINLSDPNFEPSDEDLQGLMQRAFAGLGAAREQSLAEMRVRIAKLQIEAQIRFDARKADSGKK